MSIWKIVLISNSKTGLIIFFKWFAENIRLVSENQAAARNPNEIKPTINFGVGLFKRNVD